MRHVGKSEPDAARQALDPCDLCGATDFTLAASETAHRIWRCRNCGLVQVRPLPLQTGERNSAYWRVDFDDPAVQRERTGCPSVYTYGARRLAEESAGSLQGKRALDVGCGMGTFLDLVRKQGALPYGIDISPEAGQLARKQYHIDTVTAGDFETADFQPASFHIITGWNVLEHTRSPRRWLAQAHRLLADGGLLLVKVPNVTFSGFASRLSPALRMLRLPTTSYLASRTPLHLYGFTSATLRRSLAEASFDVLSVERPPVRDTSGLKGRLIVAMATIATALCAGRLEFHPVLMALARKRQSP